MDSGEGGTAKGDAKGWVRLVSRRVCEVICEVREIKAFERLETLAKLPRKKGKEGHTV